MHTFFRKRRSCICANTATRHSHQPRTIWLPDDLEDIGGLSDAAQAFLGIAVYDTDLNRDMKPF